MATILRAAGAYIFLLVVIRLIGRRAVNQMTPFEFILLFLFGGITIQAVVTDDRSLVNAFLAVMTIALMHVLVAWLKQCSAVARKLLDGTPVPIVEDGQWNEDRMRKMRLQEQDVMSAARQQGVKEMAEVKYAIVERSGDISIIKQDKEAA